MADRKTSKDAKEELRSARAALRDDMEALGRKVHVDLPARVKRKAPILAAGAAAAGAVAAGIVVAKRRRKKARSRPAAAAGRRRAAKRRKR